MHCHIDRGEFTADGQLVVKEMYLLSSEIVDSLESDRLAMCVKGHVRNHVKTIDITRIER
jgi:hypothetical protein